ncbi:glucose-6-phosphate isomerase [Corynebacterium terpenotabidum]|uniref:Glucose-6-phosphate isomerase n=1 Tax=Corynebacterium terpenotabidum Y-11 TaxID=1200352 RepID=S4XAT1_9CORY|nr:glucose-6-phosphate isomerase [Corynebacterium terpenotabidum]AGP30247.1 glucose-6-phosphate isomerase [Corynebacterium terpenotabidum Y-11]
MTELTSLPEWTALLDQAPRLRETTLRELFREDPGRSGDLTFEVGPLHVDLSKNLVDTPLLRQLTTLAQAAGVEAQRAAMFAGKHINTTEDRAVLHTALRIPVDQDLTVDGQDVAADVHEVLGRMRDFARGLRSGTWRGSTGHTVKEVVNIGIGGSDLGPAMAAKALRAYQVAGIHPHFVSNVDPSDLVETLENLDAESTLFIISSKTFTTSETLANAHAARRWLLAELGTDTSDEDAVREVVSRHFVAVSTNAEEVSAFGIDTKNMFGFWDWVGGRYSVDSAIGLSLMAAIGPRDFMEFLAGFRDVDDHFSSEPLEMNVPVLMGMLGVWYTGVLGAQSHAVLPYSHDLGRFPAYLQQLTMESNGKSVCLDGSQVSTETGEIYWGEPGTNGQHAFFQLLHQGTHLIPADFVGFVNPHEDLVAADGSTSMHDMLLANFLAQSKVLAFGRSEEELRESGVEERLIPHKVMPGNRPSTTILADKLTPRVLGALIALYEHITFVQGVVWGVNSFDQWGVELGKEQASNLLPLFSGDNSLSVDTGDASTDDLVEFIRAHRVR